MSSFFAWRQASKFLQAGINVFDGSGSTRNRKLAIFSQRVLQLFLFSIVMQIIQIFCGGPAMFIATCFLAQADCRNFLPEHCNTIITHQLCGEELPSLLSLLEVDLFQGKQDVLQQTYHHTATERLYRLCNVKFN